ncbi:MAG TPA: methyltransferase domain-containing protein [Actinomadura sp.]|jgi:23S rRNA (guanine745-N1)-methyltransferase|nr:methyltransferase domain-containing protein [Actinomadura sp.]
MLSEVVDDLVCPLCGAGLTESAGSLRCGAGHAFDIARQGYVNLLPGGARPGTADTPEMARARADFLGAGHFGSLMRLLADRVQDLVKGQEAERGRTRGAVRSCADSRPRVVDAGAGTGDYLAAVLDRLPRASGIALDISKHALRRAARAHQRIGAVTWDVWRPLPIRDASMDIVLNVFAPRNGPEFRRILRPDGALVVITPTTRHLETLVGPLGLLSVGEAKTERVGETLGGDFRLAHRESHGTELLLDHLDVETLVGMGPSAHHVPPDLLRERIEALPASVRVPASFTLSVFRPEPVG